MTASHVTGAHGALTRRLLSLAIGGGSSHWARVHGYQRNRPADQVHGEGVDVCGERRLWRIDINDGTIAVRAIISVPRDMDRPRRPTARRQQARPPRLAAATCDGGATEQIDAAPADIALQVAVADQLIYR